MQLAVLFLAPPSFSSCASYANSGFANCLNYTLLKIIPSTASTTLKPNVLYLGSLGTCGFPLHYRTACGTLTRAAELLRSMTD